MQHGRWEPALPLTGLSTRMTLFRMAHQHVRCISLGNRHTLLRLSCVVQHSAWAPFLASKGMRIAGHHGLVGVYQHICAACGGPPRLASRCWAHPVALASGQPHPSFLHQSPHCIAHSISPGCFLVPHSFSLETHTTTTMNVKSTTDMVHAGADWESCHCCQPRG